jgi:hypothetical protein
MIFWTVSAAPVVPTASYSSSGSTTSTDSFDSSGEEKFTGQGGQTGSASRITSSDGNEFATEFGSSTGNDGFSFYNSGGGLDFDNSNSIDASGLDKTTQSWNGAFTVSHEDNDTTYTLAASSSTFSATRDTSTTTTTASLASSLAVASSTAMAGTTVSTNGATIPTTTTRSVTAVGVGGNTVTRSTEATTTHTFSQTGWYADGVTKFPSVTANTIYKNVTQNIFYSATNPGNGLFYSRAQSLSGSFVLSSAFRTGQGNVLTVTNSSTFTATTNSTATTQEVKTITQQKSTSALVYPAINQLPLVQTSAQWQQDTTTTTNSTAFGVTFGSHLPTQITAVADTSTFAADLGIERTITFTNGTKATFTTASFVTVGSGSTTNSSGPADFNGAPSSGATGITTTENSAWQETFPTGFNFAYGAPGQSVAGEYYFNGWAAAGSFANVGRVVVANIGSVTMPMHIVGNQTVRAFVGSTNYSNSSGFFTVAANGRNAFVTKQTGTLRETSSAQMLAQDSAVVRTFVSGATAGGGNDALGPLSVAILPGAYFTTNQSGASGSQIFSNGQNTQVGATAQKTAMLPAPYYVGSNGDQWLFSAVRNFTDI